MIGRVLIGGLCLCGAAALYLGWRLGRAHDTLSESVQTASERIGRSFESPSTKPVDHGTRALPGEAGSNAAPDALQPLEREPLATRTDARSVCGSVLELPRGGLQPRSTSSPEPGSVASAEELEHCVQALRHDGIRWNATRAIEDLVRNGSRSLPALERALRSTDEQQRALAACTIVRIPGHVPSRELAHALFEQLVPAAGRDGSDITARAWIRSIGRAGIDERETAFASFAGDPALFREVEHELAALLPGPLSAVRFDAAAVILRRPEARARAAAVDVLIEHLADNELTDDAAVAMRILAHAGHAAVAAVRAALPGRDTQQALLLGHFLARFEPAHGAARALAPKELRSLGFFRGDMLADELAARSSPPPADCSR